MPSFLATSVESPQSVPLTVHGRDHEFREKHFDKNNDHNENQDIPEPRDASTSESLAVRLRCPSLKESVMPF